MRADLDAHGVEYPVDSLNHSALIEQSMTADQFAIDKDIGSSGQVWEQIELRKNADALPAGVERATDRYRLPAEMIWPPSG